MRYKVVGALLSALLLVPVVLMAVKRLDIVTVTYASHAAARDAGALGPGKWLPGGLPASAVGIREMHSIDTNELWFSYTSASNGPPEDCSPRAMGDVAGPRVRRVSKVETFARDVEVLRQSGRGRFYRCQDGDDRYYLAIDPQSDRAFGWSSGNIGAADTARQVDVAQK